MSAIGTKPLPTTGSGPILGTGPELTSVLATGIRALYQPIVRLADRRTIAYEALARGPAGAPRRPLRHRAPREPRDRPRLGVLAGGPARRPGRRAEPGPGALRQRRTERALPNHATDLIPLAEDLRRRGARIALDDIGTDPRSLALMPFLRPDVIKLDLKLMHNSPSREIAEVTQAVNAEAERTGR